MVSSDITCSTMSKELVLLTLDNSSVLGILNGNLSQYLEDHVTSNLAQFVMNNSVEDFQKFLNEKNEDEQLDVLILGKVN